MHLWYERKRIRWRRKGGGKQKKRTVVLFHRPPAELGRYLCGVIRSEGEKKKKKRSGGGTITSSPIPLSTTTSLY